MKYIFLFVFVIVLLITLMRVFFFLVKVDGHSMFPALEDNDLVLTLRGWRPSWLKYDRVVVWESTLFLSQKLNLPRDIVLVKRIIGVPGDKVTVPANEIFGGDYSKGNDHRKWDVPEDHYFLKGDSIGADSTIYGPIPKQAIKGLVIAKLWGKIPSLDKNRKHPVYPHKDKNLVKK